MPEATLNRLVTIRQNALRAVRLETDLANSEVLQGYTLTAQAVTALGRIASGLSTHARAWTLTGPYGSGKSFFGLFLAHLLDAHRPNHALAWRMLAEADAALAARLRQNGLGHSAWMAVAVTGSRAPLQTCLVRGLEAALTAGHYAPEWHAQLQQASQADSRALVRWLERFLAVGSHGVLVVFDEMGKALEHAATHPHDNDVYLLQELAELAARSHAQPLAFVGILHQTFEQYAVLLDTTTQREWAKVQGRFEDLPFQEPPVEQIRLLARAFTAPVHQPALADMMPGVEQAGWRPATLTATEFAQLCARVYPLHPSVLVTLPFLFRRLAQNERSLFAYLGSHEPYGFQEFLARQHPGDFVHLHHLFDYLVTNHQARLYASGRARPIIETLERLENTPDLPALETALLKTLGIVSWLSEISPLRATEAMLVSALHVPPHPPEAWLEGLQALKKRSLVTFRRYNQTYVVWQGSDVDIEERLQAAHAALDQNFRLAEALQTYLTPRPVLARRHSYQTGTQRFFEVRYVDTHTLSLHPLRPSAEANGLVVLALPGTLAEVTALADWAGQGPPATQPEMVVGVAGRAIRLKELVRELRGLHWVNEHTPELRDDPVARREWRTRLANVERTIRVELEEWLSVHQASDLTGYQWYHQGASVTHQVRRGLSALLSNICDSLYPHSPHFKNELLNRRGLSAQAAGARRILIEGVLTRNDQPLLGIEKFPPERSMYETLLRVGELHVWVNDRWQLQPPPAHDPLKLAPAWQAIYDFVFAPVPEPRPLTDLLAHLTGKPYGVTLGLAPVLLAVFYKVHENEATLYKEGTLLVEPDMADWEVLLRRPELFAIAGCRVTGLRAAVVERMARGLRVPAFVMPVVRALITRLKTLPDHAWRTRRIPQSAINLRRAVEQARSPERFLFVELPAALELPPFTDHARGLARLEAFFEELNATLDSLSQATPRVIAWARDTWLAACGLPTGQPGWDHFQKVSLPLAERVTHPGLLPLLKRVAEAADSRAALESALALVASRPVQSWTDVDADRFSTQAQHLGKVWQEQVDQDPEIPSLPPRMHKEAQSLAAQLGRYARKQHVRPEVIQAALRLLLDNLRTEHNRHMAERQPQTKA